MPTHRWFILSSLLLLLAVTGCGRTGLSEHKTLSSRATPLAPTESSIQFTLSGNYAALYTLHAASPTSKLRHGHREFTINVTDADRSIFIAFYGYQGPGRYTLSQYINGGDIHLSLGNNAPSWDLSVQSKAQCTMVVNSDSPTSSVGLDRMTGSFSCPLLFAINNSPQAAVAVHNGTFDIAMIVES